MGGYECQPKKTIKKRNTKYLYKDETIEDQNVYGTGSGLTMSDTGDDDCMQAIEIQEDWTLKLKAK